VKPTFAVQVRAYSMMFSPSAKKKKKKKKIGFKRQNARNKFREDRSADSKAVMGDTDTHRIATSYVNLFHSKKESALKCKIA
jgi:ribosomal protein S8E